MNRAALLITAAFFISSAQASQWNVMDVSYLYPLPASLESSQNLRAGDSGPRGVLFPESLYERLGPAIRGFEHATERSRLRVLGVRIDPCGLDVKGKGCFAEIRMVWQPLHLHLAKVQAEDGAFHSFYRLSPSEFKSLIKELADMKRQNASRGVITDQQPLNVHPAFVSPVTRDFAAKFNSLLLRYCGEKNLVQLTLLRQEAPFGFWHRFEGLFLKDGKWESIPIPRISPNDSATSQEYFNDTDELPESANRTALKMRVSILPSYIGHNNLEPYTKGHHTPTPNELNFYIRGLQATHRIENPTRLHTGNLDCVSCHIAEPSRFFFKANFPGIDAPGNSQGYRYEVPKSWIDQAKQTTMGGRSTKVIRAFGYYFDKPAVNTRAIHESIRVAEELQKAHSDLL